ncbi:MAG: fibronectin type III domain-containing protein [Planctomycetota bacterium]|jgi:DNA-directed RNA polymerase subunit N (RpoN/RPB10)
MTAYTYTTALIAPDTDNTTSGFQGTKFTGVFDGAGFKVTNLIIDTAGADNDYLGLFGYTDSTGTVNNLGLEDVNITGGDYSTRLGGLAGSNSGTISNCFSTGSVIGGDYSWYLGGLVGYNYGTISDCFSTASLTSGNSSFYLGGLAGTNSGTISDCFSTGSVIGGDYSWYLGGLVGANSGIISDCFWDINTSGMTTSAGGIGKTTPEMQTKSTFTDAGWDFTTPVWKICETVDYPRLAWEKIPAPILNPEPDITTGPENTVSWQDVNEAVEYYAVCCNDPNLEDMIMDTSWIDTNEVTFAGLNTGQTYYYAVKARQNCVMESDWSNVVWSMQVTLGDAVDVMLDPNSLKNANMANALSNKIDEVLAMIDAGNYQAALKKLENDILKKTDGCANSGKPDKNDWIKTCEQQGRIYPLIMETIEYVEGLIE